MTAPIRSTVVRWFTSAGREAGDALGDEDDRQRVGDRPDEEGDVPPDVALDQVDVALDDADEADHLVTERCGGALHQSSPFSSSLVLALFLERFAGRREERVLEGLAP